MKGGHERKERQMTEFVIYLTCVCVGYIVRDLKGKHGSEDKGIL